jgi:hypothetical protein
LPAKFSVTPFGIHGVVAARTGRSRDLRAIRVATQAGSEFPYVTRHKQFGHVKHCVDILVTKLAILKSRAQKSSLTP